MHISKQRFFSVMTVVVLLNYIAQIPYYIHQYFAPHHYLPNLFGSILLAITLLWFLSGFWLMLHKSTKGFWLLLSFFVVEFLFYLQTQISQLLISHRILLHVYRPDNAVLFVVFGLGYLNFVAAAYFIAYLVGNRQLLTKTAHSTTGS